MIKVADHEMSSEDEMAMAIQIRESLAGELTAKDEAECVELFKKCAWWKDDLAWPFKTSQFEVRLDKIANPLTNDFYKTAEQVSQNYKDLFTNMDQVKDLSLPIPSYSYISYLANRKNKNCTDHQDYADHYGRIFLPQEIMKNHLSMEIDSQNKNVFSVGGLYKTLRTAKKEMTEFYCIDLTSTQAKFMEYRNTVLKVVGNKADDQKHVTILCAHESNEMLVQEQKKKLVNPGLSQQKDKFTYIYV